MWLTWNELVIRGNNVRKKMKGFLRHYSFLELHCLRSLLKTSSDLNRKCSLLGAPSIPAYLVVGVASLPRAICIVTGLPDMVGPVEFHAHCAMQRLGVPGEAGSGRHICCLYLLSS